MYEQEARTEVEAENGAKFLFHDTQGIPRTAQEMQWSMNNNYVIPAFRNGYYDTNMLLKYVDLKLDWYTPSEEAFEIIAFIRVALGKEPENVNSKPHFFFIDCMLGSREVIPYFKVRNLDVRELLGKSTLILSTREFSKALHHKTLIATPEGDKEIGKLNVGDYVFSRTGEVTRIRGKSGLILDNTYNIVLEDGREFKASNDHEHIVWVKDSVNSVDGFREVVLTSQELYTKVNSGVEYFIPRMNNGIQYSISSNVWYVGEIKRILNGSINPSVSKLKYETLTTRLEVLRELFRHSGSLSSTGMIEFNTEFLNVAWYIRDVIYSIGGYCKIIKEGINKYKLEIVSNRYKLFIDGINSKFLRYLPEYDMFKIESMALVHSEPSYCISVECPTKSFVLSNGIVTHNSVLVTFFMLYMAWKGELRNFGKVNFGLYVSDKMGPSGNVSLTMSTIETLVQQSEFLSSQFEEVKCTQEYAILVRNPRTPAEVKAYNKAMRQGKKLDEVPLRGERTFTLKGIGSSGGRGSRSKSLQRPQFCHEKGTIVTTDMGTHKVEDYYKCGEPRIEKGVTVKLRGLITTENVTKEHRYWCAKIGSDDRPKWVEAKDLTDMHVIGTPTKDEDSPFLYSWKRVEYIKFNDYESEYIPIQTPSHTYTTEFGLSHNCIFDDMVANEKDAHSDVKLEAIESTIEGDVGKSLAPKHFKIFIGTAYAEKDPIYKRVTDGTTLPIVFPKAEQIPKEGTPKEGFISVWEDRFPYHIQRADYARAEEAYKRGNPEPLRLVNQENYCRITSEKDRLIPEDMIKFEPMYDVIANAPDYLWRITTDFTTTGGIDSDDSSIDLWAIDWLGTYRLIDLELDKTELEEQYELVYQMAKKAYQWSKKPIEIAIEIDGQQAVHLYALKMYLEKKGFNQYYFAKEIDPQGKGKSYEGIKSKNAGSKLDRLKLLLPLFMKGQMIFNSSLQDTPQMIRLLNQIEQVTYTKIIAKHDDGLDGLSQNALIDTYLPPKPLISSSKQATKQISLMEALIGYNDNNDDSLDDYYNMNYGR